MKRRRNLGLLAIAAVLVSGIASFTIDGVGPALEGTSAIRFQRITGGFGIGGVVEPSWCFHAMDPRRESLCPTALRPVPGLSTYCPLESTGLSDHGH